VVAVAVSSVAVTTQVYCVWVPFRAPRIRGSAVDTMVELISATNRTSIRPLSASSRSRWVISGARRGASTTVISSLPERLTRMPPLSLHVLMILRIAQ
jgi:hypothetical protein